MFTYKKTRSTERPDDGSRVRRAISGARLMTTYQLVGLALIVLALIASMRPSARAAGNDPLDRLMFNWPDGTPFTQRNMLESVVSIGASGSGKTSGTGRHFARSLAAVPNSGVLVLCSKPEEAEFFLRILRAAGREKDAILFGPKHPSKFNLLNFLGGDARNATTALLTIGETLKRGKTGGGGDDGKFWEQQKERGILLAITTLQIAGEPVSAPNIQKLIQSAPTSSEVMLAADRISDEALMGKARVWRAGYCNFVMGKATEAAKTQIQAFDFEQCQDYWLGEWPGMNDKTRSNIIAEILGVLSVFNTGIVRELLSTETTISLGDLAEGKWIICDMPTMTHGDSGLFVNAALKYAAQRFVLAREARGDDGIICLWSDEYQGLVNSFDAVYLAECRSHRGCMVVLTQSIHSIYSSMSGERGKHYTDALLTNFATKSIHRLGDAESAEYASGLLGQRIDVLTSGAPGEQDNWFDAPAFKPSFNEHVLPVVQPSTFMTGRPGNPIRTGGSSNGYMVDAVIIRPELFASTGERYAFVSFSQR